MKEIPDWFKITEDMSDPSVGELTGTCPLSNMVTYTYGYRHVEIRGHLFRSFLHDLCAKILPYAKDDPGLMGHIVTHEEYATLLAKNDDYYRTQVRVLGDRVLHLEKRLASEGVDLSGVL